MAEDIGMIDWVKLALETGATKAYMLPVCEIPFDPALRAYCEVNACGTYGKNYGCPPYAGTTEEVIARAMQYETALVFQTISNLDNLVDKTGYNPCHCRPGKNNQNPCSYG